MTLLSIDELKTLVANPETPCVSLYMPMQKAGPEIRQNPIRFKNLIREAEERLDTGIRHTEALNLLKPAMELDRVDFWEHQDQGLVILISPNLFRYYCLPIEFPELVVVGEQFHLKPLLHLINNDGSFYVLALSQKDVKLFAGTAHSFHEVQINTIPHRLAETLLEDELQKGVQHGIGTPRGATASAQHPGSVHGQGSSDREKHEEDILQFFYAIDTALHEKLREEKAPLVLAGVEYLFPIYQEANTYPHLVEESINGNPEVINLEQLHDEAWRIVAPSFQEEKKAAIELYQQFAGEDNGKATSDIKEIIPAAYYQRVDSLFVSVDDQTWGKFDSETSTVDLHAEPEPDDEDMLDCAAVHTLLNGGRVYTLESGEMPHGATAAAIFRY
ncbi:hypothetical protein H6G54_04250 [Anabaena cylindrica FACHB-243]|uniref:Uncharacterized protein n=1 Tax=Anabaena cylindrica (strain ATCC 27899 / PCC 7122) TaxID=272123 RepID=K9ZJ19_ANACC|nr:MULTISPECIES: hypothetical protein [Anabaena]AFZ58345.1 hypothetical protein Anacy_2921 [Anabaena cylindrica PCC 7122]MBD2416938.1 hypothetical protein [Anabaena cylindrica FACHB-243]MBY5281810.1 hypothetical protein [Anabaena sp. CCAP 1446/1C]MBY5310100.1 hypothetical protein [Anabaena sp. CCAP 1446/1C]MCM2406470.1 hypothetical protein [Anabaena sp. CCAP 1446/1C]